MNFSKTIKIFLKDSDPYGRMSCELSPINDFEKLLKKLMRCNIGLKLVFLTKK